MSFIVEFVCKGCNTRFFKRPEDLGTGVPQCPVCMPSHAAGPAKTAAETPLPKHVAVSD